MQYANSSLDAIVIRTSWLLFSIYGKNFVKTMLIHLANNENYNRCSWRSNTVLQPMHRI